MVDFELQNKKKSPVLERTSRSRTVYRIELNMQRSTCNLFTKIDVDQVITSKPYIIQIFLGNKTKSILIYYSFGKI